MGDPGPDGGRLDRLDPLLREVEAGGMAVLAESPGDLLGGGASYGSTVAVPIRFANDDQSKGIKRGGVLNAVRHELELVCDAAEIPEEVVVDLAGTDIGDSIHISAVTLPKGTTSAITDRDFTIATIVAPSGVKSEAAEAAAAEAGEAPAADEVPTVGDEAAAEGDEA